MQFILGQILMFMNRTVSIFINSELSIIHKQITESMVKRNYVINSDSIPLREQNHWLKGLIMLFMNSKGSIIHEQQDSKHFYMFYPSINECSWTHFYALHEQKSLAKSLFAYFQEWLLVIHSPLLKIPKFAGGLSLLFSCLYGFLNTGAWFHMF